MKEKEWKEGIDKILVFVEDMFNRSGPVKDNGVLAFKIIDAKKELGGEFLKVSDTEMFSRLNYEFDNIGLIIDERKHLDGGLVIQIFKSDSIRLKEMIESGEYTEIQEYV